MPPKKQQGASRKTEQKQKEKIIEDKTFGLKNKKGARQQKFIKVVTTQINQGAQKKREFEKLLEEKAKKKDSKEKQLEELSLLFKPVQSQKIEKGVDPKSVLCVFFKQGGCLKGNKCKFSHDPAVERKTQKINIYEDNRDNDTMDTWDDEKLKDVVNKKHGEANKIHTTIICKYFIDAVEESKYGWFWECPNGRACIYRHALPPDFVLKKDKKKFDDQKEEISMEDLIETERAALGVEQTRVTLQTFLAWKKRKRAEKLAMLESEKDRKKADFRMGKSLGLSGRELFEMNPDFVAGDDADAGDMPILAEEDEEEDTLAKELNISELGSLAREADSSGTQVSSRVFDVSRTTAVTDGSASSEPTPLPSIASTMSTSTAVDELADAVADMPIDEDLFQDEDLDDLES